jgi:hypothetical protein
LLRLLLLLLRHHLLLLCTLLSKLLHRLNGPRGHVASKRGRQGRSSRCLLSLIILLLLLTAGSLLCCNMLRLLLH